MTIVTILRLVRFRRAIPSAALASFLLAPALLAQQSNAMTPTLLRRLAEAVDGHRTGTPVWVVGDYQFPHHVHAVVPTRDSAVADSTWIAGERPGTGPIGIFGPFVAPVDPESPLGPPGPPSPEPVIVIGGFTLPGCIHDGQSNMFPRAICPSEWIPQDQIAAIRIEYSLITGDTLTRPVPITADAIFFTLPALDKFVFPYYGRILGLGYALDMRRRVIEGMP